MILSTRKNGEKVSSLFSNVESIICTDSFSYKIFQMIMDGKGEEDLKKELLSHIHIE